MVKSIRNIETFKGKGIKEQKKNEKKNLKTVRKSLVSNKLLEKGSKIKVEDIDIKRPGTGIEPKFMDVIKDMKLIRDVKKDQILTWEDFKIG